jgi:hypothetical protein
MFWPTGPTFPFIDGSTFAVSCLASGFTRREHDTPTPIQSAIVELWDSYPLGTRLSVDTSDRFGHFGPWPEGGTIVAKANGYCPEIIDDFPCTFQPSFVSLEPLDIDLVETRHHDDYFSLSSQLDSYPVHDGDVITAIDPQGITCGLQWIDGDGSDQIRIFGDDPRTAVDEGAREGDTITFWLNCRFPVAASRAWHNIGDPVNELHAAVPTEYALLQNYPNPFNAGTTMSFDLKDEAEWSLTVYNIVGQRVRRFAGQDAAGRLSVQWDGRGESGDEMASGVYFYRVTANEFTANKKMLLLK